MKTKATISGYIGCERIKSLESIIFEISIVPEICAIMTKAKSRKNPPIPVIPKAVSALLRDSALSLLNPIKKNELILVSSQKIKRRRILFDRTTPNIADINISK